MQRQDKKLRPVRVRCFAFTFVELFGVFLPSFYFNHQSRSIKITFSVGLYQAFVVCKQPFPQWVNSHKRFFVGGTSLLQSLMGNDNFYVV
jgi:hypothetical protein